MKLIMLMPVSGLDDGLCQHSSLPKNKNSHMRYSIAGAYVQYMSIVDAIFI